MLPKGPPGRASRPGTVQGPAMEELGAEYRMLLIQVCYPTTKRKERHEDRQTDRHTHTYTHTERERIYFYLFLLRELAEVTDL